MANIAFYAPLKSPNHPVPSGDRQMARLLQKTLSGGDDAHKLTLVSELRSYDGKGNPAIQNQLFEDAGLERARLKTNASFDLWVSYHNYYKAPDLLGPTLSNELNIPYVLLEATRARKRLTGPWAQFAQAAERANDAADLIFHFTERDGIALHEQGHTNQSVVPLAPFLDQTTLAPAIAPQLDHRKTILSVGMMRGSDKFASYARIAETLKHLKVKDWRLVIVGGGPRRAEIEALFADFDAQVSFTGQLDQIALAQAYAQAAAFLWPGINEAYGMVYLEAQAAGLPALAEDRPGVRDVLPASALLPADDPKAMAARLDSLLSNAQEQRSAALAAHAYVQARHLFPAARTQIFTYINPLLKGR